MGVDATPERGPERAVNGVRRRLADIDAAQRDLGFRATVTLREGLSDLVKWWRSETRNPVGVAS